MTGLLMNVKTPSDSQLLADLRKSGGAEEQALSIIYRNNKSLVEKLILKNGGSKEEAKDVFQDAVIDFYENVQEGKFRGQSTISSYLYSIARFKWLNRLKRRKTETRIIDTQQHEIFEESFEMNYIEKENESQVFEIFEQLGTSCKELLIYTMYYSYSMADVISKLKFNSEQVARNQKYRCLKKLKEKLKQQPDLLNFLKPE